MKWIARLAVAATALISSAAFAGTQVLGFEIGVTTPEQVKARVANKGKVEEGGTSSLTSGPVLKSDGAAFEVEGLQTVTYVFGQKNTLVALLMTMNKSKFDSVYSALAAKYKVAKKERPFVGNQSALFNTQDGVIVAEAPHLSFDMTVLYSTKDFWKSANAKVANDEATKRKREASQF